MLRFITRVHAWTLTRGEGGQATAEYALVLLGAALPIIDFFIVQCWSAES